MKINRFNGLLFAAIAALVLLLSWGFLHRPQPRSLFDGLSADARWFLHWRLFGLGNLPVTPLFLAKCTIFLIVLTIISRMSRKFLDKEILSHTSMDRGQQYAIVRGFGYLVFLFGLIIGLDSSGLNLRSLLVVGGALGVGVGFGLQNIVANFVAGLVILWERPVKVGDLIDAGNTNGEVVRIGARGTWVRTFDNEVIIVPNSEFINNRVTNWTANDRTVRVSVPIGIAYDCKIENVRELLLDVARRNPDVLANPAPAAIVTGFGDNAVNIVLRASTGRAERVGLIKSDLLIEIFRVFREQKIEMPFPQRDLHIRSVEAPFAITLPPARPGTQSVAGETAA